MKRKDSRDEVHSSIRPKHATLPHVPSFEWHLSMQIQSWIDGRICEKPTEFTLTNSTETTANYFDTCDSNLETRVRRSTRRPPPRERSSRASHVLWQNDAERHQHAAQKGVSILLKLRIAMGPRAPLENNSTAPAAPLSFILQVLKGSLNYR